MKKRCLVVAMSTAFLGAGCFGPPAYVQAPVEPPNKVQPNVEGAKASTGGAEATITPALSNDHLVKALPTGLKSLTAGEATITNNPVPLPDGTRTEYPVVTREYQDGAGGRIGVTLTDTRGIPALKAYLGSDADHDLNAARLGVRGELSGMPSWSSVASSTDGVSLENVSMTLLYRERFIIQLDGNSSITLTALKAFVDEFNFKQLD